MNEIIEKHIELYGDYKEVRIGAYKSYLDETDYVVIKMSEVMVEGGNTEDIKLKYAEILAERETAREKINELEKQDR